MIYVTWRKLGVTGDTSYHWLLSYIENPVARGNSNHGDLPVTIRDNSNHGDHPVTTRGNSNHGDPPVTTIKWASVIIMWTLVVSATHRKTNKMSVSCPGIMTFKGVFFRS